MGLNLEGLAKRAYNPIVAIAENAAYYLALSEVGDLYKNDDPPLLIGIAFLPLAAYATCDGISRIVFNQPIYKLYSKVK